MYITARTVFVILLFVLAFVASQTGLAQSAPPFVPNDHDKIEDATKAKCYTKKVSDAVQAIQKGLPQIEAGIEFYKERIKRDKASHQAIESIYREKAGGTRNMEYNDRLAVNHLVKEEDEDYDQMDVLTKRLEYYNDALKKLRAKKPCSREEAAREKAEETEEKEKKARKKEAEKYAAKPEEPTPLPPATPPPPEPGLSGPLPPCGDMSKAIMKLTEELGQLFKKETTLEATLAKDTAELNAAMKGGASAGPKIATARKYVIKDQTDVDDNLAKIKAYKARIGDLYGVSP